MDKPIASTIGHSSAISRLCFQPVRSKTSQNVAYIPEIEAEVRTDGVKEKPKEVSSTQSAITAAQIATPIGKLKQAKSFMDAFSPLKPVNTTENGGGLSRSTSYPSKTSLLIFAFGQLLI